MYALYSTISQCLKNRTQDIFYALIQLNKVNKRKKVFIIYQNFLWNVLHIFHADVFL